MDDQELRLEEKIFRGYGLDAARAKPSRKRGEGMNKEQE
jgi:hypothetical protein